MTSETRGEKEPTTTPVSDKSSTRTGTSLDEYVTTSSSTGSPPRERPRGLEVAHGELTDYVTKENLVYKFAVLSINESSGDIDGPDLETESLRLEQGEQEPSPPASGLQSRGAVGPPPEANVPPVLTDIEGLDQESLERGVSTLPPASLPRHREPSGVETTRASRPFGVNASEAGEPSNVAPIRQNAGSVVARPLLLTLRELAIEARLKMKRRVAEQFGGGEPECPALKTSKF